ncbi:hypothetical protein CLCHR_31150 [Clostridium chromiireducens]|uniref:Uncharacterized protein n=1 Tax=Clostridium chromiireducens TaxID=225345 RepID=A0A1V4IJK0_9CLOT|nr:hypothetical protein CLCHR_31150 [Clostridium chromiireducens]
MKRFFMVFSIFLFLFFNIYSVTTVAASKSFSEGFYSPKDLNLMENVNYTIQNVSPSYDSYLIIFDDSERTQQAVRLEPNSQPHILLPIKHTYKMNT